MSLILRSDPVALSERFREAAPFPHAVIDGLFEDAVLEKIVAGFPAASSEAWQHFENARERKLGNLAGLRDLDPSIGAFLCAMSSPAVLDFLERLSGIDGLIPDPYLGGGGLHQVVRGGFLDVHTDFNWHPKLRLDRRLNLLIYLNRDWREEYGGHLELWDRSASRAERRILPTFNRTVIFSTTDSAFHGHPQPLACPEGMTRKSLSFYYYTNGRPDAERSTPHDTIFPAPQGPR
ncbi:MAG TPA: 2OG-Fe(II) oxygenase [Thermoanaerobaculia bacterium]|jgi:hypothetical protein|nr:2OG-Fe(II) oxygenase [Thermoanaerobaculia bacterium]